LFEEISPRREVIFGLMCLSGACNNWQWSIRNALARLYEINVNATWHGVTDEQDDMFDLPAGIIRGS
jgi:hypothetical protein